MAKVFKHLLIHGALYSALPVLLVASVPAAAAPFDASNAMDPAYSGQSRPYGRPAAAIGEGYGRNRDAEEFEVPESEVTEEKEPDKRLNFGFYPAIGAGVTWNDNYFAEPDDTNNATIYNVYGSLGVRANYGSTNMGVNLRTVYSEYHVEGQDVYSEFTSIFDGVLSADISRAGEKIQGGASIDLRSS